MILKQYLIYAYPDIYVIIIGLSQMSDKHIKYTYILSIPNRD